MGRRTLLLITSILVAAVGTALIGLYVKGADSRAVGKQAQVTVLVANGDIAAGTPEDPSLFSQVQRAASSLPGDPVSDPSAVRGKTALTKIYARQVIETSMFGAASAVSPAGIQPQHLGITVDLSDPARAAGLLQLGSKIDIFTQPNAGQAGVKKSEPVAQNVTVIQIGNERTSTPSATASADNEPRTLIGLDVTMTQAKAIKDAQVNGTLYFAVLGAAAAQSSDS